MPSCCEAPSGRDQIFNTRIARRRASRYRKRGPDRAAQRVIDAAAQIGLDDATILEIGGGVGEIHIELLKRGARRATNLELSHGYEVEADSLLREAGLRERVDRQHIDIATSPGAVEPADIVVMHRVVCCYPDYQRLLTAAADHARRILVFSYPPPHPGWRAAMGLEKLVLRVMRNDFRPFLHSPRAMFAVVAGRGLRPSKRRGTAWCVVAAPRAGGESAAAATAAAGAAAAAHG
jgi:magnesium-protoporphyrin O-methyltransferase